MIFLSSATAQRTAEGSLGRRVAGCPTATAGDLHVPADGQVYQETLVELVWTCGIAIKFNHPQTFQQLNSRSLNNMGTKGRRAKAEKTRLRGFQAGRVMLKRGFTPRII